MCDFSPSIPQMKAAAPPPAPTNAPKLGDPLGLAFNKTDAAGNLVKKVVGGGFSSLQISRDGSNGLNIPKQ